jgi:hypothetical protein
MVAAGNGFRRQPVPPLIKKKKNKKNLLLLNNRPNHGAAPSEHTRQDMEQPAPTWNVTDEDRDVARMALAECFRRQHPDRTPRIFDDADIERVAFCAAAINGDAQSKLQALLDAIAGATRRSKTSPPTVRYIWGRIEHFLRHAQRGRQMREAPEPATQTPAERPATSEPTQTPAERPATSEPPNTPHVGPSREQMQADLAKLFGPTWRVRP